MKRILAVDDDIDILRLLEVYLRKQYHLMTATGGAEGLKILSEGLLPDLILLDVDMPGMNGIEFQKQLAADDRLKNIPVIYLTADNHNNDRLIHKSEFDFLTKPITKEDLLYIIEAVFLSKR